MRFAAAMFLALFASHAVQVPDESPRGVVQAAAHAHQADSTDQLALAWGERARKDRSDRLAHLGLATLARLAPNVAVAESLYAHILADPRRDGVAGYAQMGRAVLLARSGAVARAESLYAEAALMLRATGDSAGEIRAYDGLAALRGRTVSAQAALLILDSAYSRVPQGDDDGLALIHCRRATLLASSAPERALLEAEAGVRSARRSGIVPRQAFCTYALASLHWGGNRWAETAEAAAEAAALFMQARDRASAVTVLQLRAAALRVRGDYGAARTALAEVMSEAEAVDNRLALSWARFDLGRLSIALRDHSEARRHIEQARAEFEAQGDRLGMARALIPLGQLAGEERRFTEGLARLDSVVVLAAEFEDAEMAFDALQARLSIAAIMNDLPLADSTLSRMQLIARTGRVGMWGEDTLLAEGLIALRRGEARRARPVLTAYYASSGEDQHAYRHRILVHLSAAHAMLGDLDEAERVLRDANARFDLARAAMPQPELRMLALQQGAGFGLVTESLARIVSALAADGRVESAIEFVEYVRARELSDRMHRRRAEMISGADATHSPEARTATIAQLRNAAQTSRSAIVYFVAGTASAPSTAFVVSGDRPAAVQLPPLDSLEPEITRYLALLQGGNDATAVAKRLSEALISPVLALVPDSVSRLTILPDGALHHLPFDALLMDDGRYLIERFATATIPSGAVLVDLLERPRVSISSTSIVMGDPRFAQEQDAPNAPGVALVRNAFLESGSGLARLHGSRGEARAVARQLPAATLRMREGASEFYLKSRADEPLSVVHLATHALVHPGTATRTAIALSPGGGEDGFLSAAEVGALRLPAELVFLSACRTATGVLVAGEGMQGLTGPLLEAGARSVVATHWPVADAGTTGRFVTTFYSEVAAGLDVADALRAAKLAAIRSGSRPAEWAAFTLVGDPTVTFISRRGRSNLLTTWLPAALVLAIGALIVLAYRRRAARTG